MQVHIFSPPMLTMLFAMTQKKNCRVRLQKTEGNQFVTSHAKKCTTPVIIFGDFKVFSLTGFVPSHEQSIHPQS